MVLQFKDINFKTALVRFLNLEREDILHKDLMAINGLRFTTRPLNAIPIPWVSDSSAFSMVFPRFQFNITESSNGKWEEDLKYFSHIETLDVRVPTKDLSVIKEFTSLKELYISESETKDWSFIATLLNLKFLYINSSKFSNLAPIKELGQKQVKVYKEYRGKNNNPFMSPSLLKNLHLLNCSISDLSPLGEYRYIVDLNLSHNSIKDINPLKGVKALYYLTLRHNYISDISALEEIKHLYLLNLRHNQIKDISVLKGADNLSRLFLGHNPIIDYSPIKKLILIDHDIDKKYYNRSLI